MTKVGGTTWVGLCAAASFTFGAGAAGAEEWQIAGHNVALHQTEDGGYRLTADGAIVMEDGLILVDGTQTVPGGAAIFGVAGAGGNACGAAPFVLLLPEAGAPRLDGPIETCSYLEATYSGDSITWISPSLPGRLTESWIWSPGGGLVAGPTTEFAPDAGRGWSDLASLDGQHPSEALRLEPVYAALRSGLAQEDWQAYAERITDLGSGGLAEGGYLGRACLKFTCDADYAVIYLHQPSERVFAIWHVSGEIENRIWPADTTEWPPEAIAILRETSGE